jgi:hypothetical protein
LIGAIMTGSREDNLQWKLHALLIPIIAAVFVLAMGDLQYWFVGIVFGVILGFPASGAIVWLWVDVLNRPLHDNRPRSGHPQHADVKRLETAIHYLETCGTMTLAKAVNALKIAGQRDRRQSLLNTWATHKPNEVREHLRQEFAADIEVATAPQTPAGSGND